MSDHIQAFFHRGLSDHGRPTITLLESEYLDEAGNPIVPWDPEADIATGLADSAEDSLFTKGYGDRPEEDIFSPIKDDQPYSTTGWDYVQEIVGRDFSYELQSEALGGGMPEVGFYAFKGHFKIHSSYSYEGEYDEEYEWDGVWRKATDEEASYLEAYLEEDDGA